MERIAVIRMKGIDKLDAPVKDTLKMLGLHRRNWCVVVPSGMVGMIKRVKDFVTWGEIDEETYKELVNKRGEEYTSRLTDTKGKITYSYIEENEKKLKKYFRLSPPKGGFERKGTKRGFGEGGALGYRGKDINSLIRRMI